jgi:AbrB family transcriptional regulator (stage V sporulation protein T)
LRATVALDDVKLYALTFIKGFEAFGLDGRVMNDRKMVLFNEPCFLTADEDISYSSAVIAPIITEGDAVGAVIIAAKEPGITLGNLETKLAETAAGFLAKQMES